MAMYTDEPGDEDERRRRRDEDLSPYNPGLAQPPSAPAEDIYEPPPATTAPPEVLTQNVGADTRWKEVPTDPTRRTSPYDNQPTFQPPAPAPVAAAPSAPVAAAPAASTPKPAITDEVTRILMARLKALENPQDINGDPIYQKSVRAYQIGQLRDADRQRKSLAERTAATGGTTSSGGFNVGVRGIEERAGENSSRYRSGLAMDRLQARESQLVEAIKTARAVGQDEIANSLELQRLQLQQELGRGDLALRGELGRGQLGLGQDQLGFNYADLISRMNRDAVLAGLGGG